MDIKKAAGGTRLKMTSKGRNGWPQDIHSVSYEHIYTMLFQIESGGIVGEKAHRWLGWAQCAIVAARVATLDDMKNINHAA